ncbi:MAG: 2-oxoacid:acceptor oxidoreductase family protein, partial [Ruminococcus sp.]|nr:2-oxoacid:acceptor oxidoreductase family protein [Ruminococcus sp.]
MPSYVDKYDIVDDLKEGGSFLLNCAWDVEELTKRLPGKMKRILAERKINFYTIDAIQIGKEIGLGGRVNTVLQSAFFKIADIIPAEEAKEFMKAAAKKSYLKKGQAIVDMNYAAIDRGMEDLKKVEIPADWANAADDAVADKADGQGALVEYVNGILKPVNAYKGNKLPVSAFVDHIDGTCPNGSAAFEKRGIAVDVPEWQSANCIQCNRCAIVCPHAVIRPVPMTDAEVAAAPEGTEAIPMIGLKELKFVMTVSTLDCTGCGACAQVCPGKKGEKALVMKPIDSQRPKQALFDYGLTVDEKPEVAEKFKFTTVKGSQFKQPLLEFSGACAGCGETPYAKLVTQLFGDRMFIANATGCSSIWGASAPATPYTTNKKGYGPAWMNSLFEDNAEFGLGMALGQKAIRNRLVGYVTEIKDTTDNADLKAACEGYLDTITDSTSSRPATDALIAELEKAVDDAKVGELAKKTLVDKDELAKKSMWIFGGDGWAYDIGFGGLDHVIASGENVNILVFDTEVYSNTGGQSSKATPIGSVAQFAAAGKAVKKKDLAAIAMSYGYVY